MKLVSVVLMTLFVSNVFGSSEGSEHHASVTDLLYPAVNFVLLFGFIFWRIKKPISEMFKKSATDTQEYFNVAKEKDKEAQIKLTMYKNKMNQFEAEAEKLKKEAVEDARRYDQMKEQETNQIIDKMIQDAVLKVENERAVLMRELNSSLIDEVIAKTKNIISTNNDFKNKATEKIIAKI